MITVIQRVLHASVIADGEAAGACGKGLLILLGVSQEDTEKDVQLLSDKIARLRIFSDAQGKMNLSVQDVAGEALVVSNFTLLANYVHGNRPDYFSAARPEQAQPLYAAFVRSLSTCLSHVGEGRFGADMQISMVADGPVTIVMDSKKLQKGIQHAS